MNIESILQGSKSLSGGTGMAENIKTELINEKKYLGGKQLTWWSKDNKFSGDWIWVQKWRLVLGTYLFFFLVLG